MQPAKIILRVLREHMQLRHKVVHKVESGFRYERV